MGQGVAHEVNAATLPRGVQHSDHDRLEPLMRIRDDELDAAPPAACQLAQKPGSEGLGLRGADIHAQHLAPAIAVN
jgi:hypothetical protein